MLTDTLKKTNEYLEKVSSEIDDAPYFICMVQDAIQYIEPVAETYLQIDAALYLNVMSNLDYRRKLDLDFHRTPTGMYTSYTGKKPNTDAYIAYRLADSLHCYLDCLARKRKNNPFDRDDRRVLSVVRKKLRGVMEEIDTIGRLGAFDQDGE